MRIKLNQQEIRAACYERESGAHYLWDTETKGLGVRVYPSGQKSFVVTFRVRGRQRFYTLGRFGEMTLHQARTRALEVRAKARRGEDPAAERNKYRSAPKITDLAERFLQEHSRVNKKPGRAKEDERRWRKYVLPTLGHRRVADITRTDVAEIHTRMAETPSMANDVRSLLSKAFNLAELWGWRPEGSNPCRHVKRYKTGKRERYLSESELARLSEVLTEAERTRSEPLPTIAAIRLLILTGCRRGEILSLRWQDIDYEQSCLRLPDSKTGPKTVPLNSAALQLLSTLPRTEGNPYLIPGKKEETHLTSIDVSWKRLRQQAGIEDVRIHDLRHTFASFGVSLGLSLPLIGKILGHSSTATTERYAHVANNPLRSATEQIGEHIAAVMGGGPKAEVVRISG